MFPEYIHSSDEHQILDLTVGQAKDALQQAEEQECWSSYRDLADRDNCSLNPAANVPRWLFYNAASDCAQFWQLVIVQSWLSICQPTAVKTIWTRVRQPHQAQLGVHMPQLEYTCATNWCTYARDLSEQSIWADYVLGEGTRSWPAHTLPLPHVAFTQSGPVNTL